MVHYKLIALVALSYALSAPTAHAMGKQKSKQPNSNSTSWVVPLSGPSSSMSQPVCQRTHDSIQRMTALDGMGFKNDGGIFDGGTCWWHARFERSAIYLATFRPDLPEPTPNEVVELVNRIAHIQPVVIPGFSTLREFTTRNQRIVQRELNQWQLRDSARAVNSLFVSHQMRGKKLWKRMNFIYNRFLSTHASTFLYLNSKGVGLHGVLLQNMRRTGDGYELTINDNNSPGRFRTIKYSKGDRSLRVMVDGKDKYGETIPYLGFENERKRIEEKFSKMCGRSPGLDRAPAGAIMNDDVEDATLDLLEALPQHPARRILPALR